MYRQEGKTKIKIKERSDRACAPLAKGATVSSDLQSLCLVPQLRAHIKLWTLSLSEMILKVLIFVPLSCDTNENPFYDHF